MARLQMGVLISGSGTNLQAIVDACAEGRIDGEVVVVISSHVEAYGLERARKAGIPAVYLDRTSFGTFGAYNKAVLDSLESHGADLVVMAGYMRLLGKDVLRAYPHRVLNIHPALLPSFPGASGIHDAFDYGVKVTGVTVHFADEEFDRGPIIAQEPIVVAEEDTLETLEAKIHEVEHRIYPRALQLVAEDRVEIVGRKVHVRAHAG
jgi:phosphoribosylglycinamide formyltransferase-1